MSDFVNQSARKDVKTEVRNVGSSLYDYDVMAYLMVFAVALIISGAIMAFLGVGFLPAVIVAFSVGLVSIHLTNVHLLLSPTIDIICDALNPTPKEKEEIAGSVLKSLLCLKATTFKLPSRDLKVAGRSGYYDTDCGKGFVSAEPLYATHIQDRMVVIRNFTAQEYLTTRPNALSVWDEGIAALLKNDTAPTLNTTKSKV